jgi:hypothetical protein
MTIPKWISISIHLLAWVGKEHLNPRSPYFWRIRKIKGSTVVVCLNRKTLGEFFRSSEFSSDYFINMRLTPNHDDEIDAAK